MATKSFEELGVEIGQLVAAKNKSYGNAAEVAGDILKILYPHGIKPEQYREMLLITRICDKLLRITNDKGAFGESPFQDICGYSIIGWRADLKEDGENE